MPRAATHRFPHLQLLTIRAKFGFVRHRGTTFRGHCKVSGQRRIFRVPVWVSAGYSQGLLYPKSIIAKVSVRVLQACPCLFFCFLAYIQSHVFFSGSWPDLAGDSLYSPTRMVTRGFCRGTARRHQRWWPTDSELL